MAGRHCHDGEAGFSLVELVVVMVVIAVLAAVAVPVFLNQRKKAFDTRLQNDLRSLALHEETYYTDNDEYLAVATTSSPVIIDAITLSPGVSASVRLNSTMKAYCIVVDSPQASQARVHISTKGGLQPRSTTSCPDPAGY